MSESQSSQSSLLLLRCSHLATNLSPALGREIPLAPGGAGRARHGMTLNAELAEDGHMM